MMLFADFSRDDPVFKSLVAIMTMRQLGADHIHGALVAIVHAVAPNGAAWRYIEHGGSNFAEIAHRLDWTNGQLLDRLVAELRARHAVEEPKVLH
jgi:hypothetical protein